MTRLPLFTGWQAFKVKRITTMSITAKTKKTQCQILLAYLKRVRRGITSLEAAIYLHMVCVHKRVAELIKAGWPIIKEQEATANGKKITRYKLAR